MISILTWLVYAIEAYALIGLLFAIPFVFRGVNKIDPSARDGSLGFRLLILPGAAAFWPLLMRRWMRGESTLPEEDNAHREAAR